MPKVHLVGYSYSFFSKTQFIIVVFLALLLIGGILDVAAHTFSSTKTIYYPKVISTQDMNAFGSATVYPPKGATFDNPTLNGTSSAKLKDICPSGVKNIDMTKNPGIIECY